MITIKDIARAAGVNHSTVSRALNDDSRVSAAMREKIQTIARQMNYVPNLAAKKLVRHNTNFIGLIWPPKEGLFFYNMSVRLQQEGVKRGYRVVQITDSPAEAMQAFNQFGVDHVIFWNSYPSVSAAFTAERERFRGEVLTMGGPELEGTHWLSIDRRGALLKAVHHLSGLGHRKIAYAGVLQNKEKLSSFMEGIAECKCDYRPEYLLGYYDDAFEQEAERLLRMENRPTAIVIDSQLCLFRLMRIFRKCDVKIPDDMSVVVYDDTPEMEAFEIAFTTVGPSIQELAVKAWDIIARERVEDAKRIEEVVQTSLIQRGSTRPLYVRD
ncbi:LacI family DNA-binding transcriptional regulator [Paenibacillus hodogayensis]|uniref:LacI family DNA-binding transcriptional regulator n=1 Tax=Paenibacillus hodogayensis TaxID=279208 RepID=A0ABV5W7Q3_9BACL